MPSSVYPITAVSGGGGSPSGTAGGELAGTYPNPTIKDAVIDDANIVSGGLTNTAIATAAAIAKTKISGTAVTVADTGTVTSAMLAGSIAPSKVTGTAVTAADSGTVTSAMLADGTIVNADVNASAAIDSTKVVQAIGPDHAPANLGLYQKSSSTTASQFCGITALKPLFHPIDLYGVTRLTLSQLEVRIGANLAGSTVGIAIYTATYASASHVSATLVAQLNAALSGASTGMVSGAVTTGAAGSGASTYTFDFTANRYLIGFMASDVATLKTWGVTIPNSMTTLGIISWTGTARSSTTDWPSSFTEAANVASIGGGSNATMPIIDLVTATGAFYL